MRENRTCGSEGGEAQLNEPSLPLSFRKIHSLGGRVKSIQLKQQLKNYKTSGGRVVTGAGASITAHF